MRDTPATEGLLLGLAQLRSNAILAVNTSGGSAVSRNDVEQVEAIAAGLFGVSLDNVECVPVGMAPKPNGEMRCVLLDKLPDGEATAAHAFLTDLQQRVHAWLTS